MKMRYLLVASSMLLGSISLAQAEISVGIALPGISIGINMPVYPRLVRVPGYPVYYDPYVNLNYFFYDGMYWAFEGDSWYASSWYNGPWQLIEPEYVPLFILRIPVRYYRRPPVYFHGWRADAPPRWADHWGHDWEQRRSGWDRWDRRSVPAAAPLPRYQRQYSGNRYPREIEQQHAIRSGKYRYQPREAVAQQHFQQRGSARAAPQGQAPAPQRPQRQPDFQPPRQQLQTAPPVRQMQPPRPDQQPQRLQTEPQDRGRGDRAEPPGRGRENKPERQDRGREKDDERGQDRR